MNKLIFLFSIIILFFNCNSKKGKGDFFLDYLKESKLIEKGYWDDENIADSLQYTDVEYFEDSILIQGFRRGYIRCELFKTDSLFSDTIYHIGIVYPPILPHSGYIILFDKNGKYLSQKEVSGKYHLDIEFKNIDGHSKMFLMINSGDGGVGTFHDIININTVINNEIISLYEYHQKYESWYDESNVIKDSLIHFSYQSKLNQVMMINQITKGNELNDNFEITEQYQDTTIIPSNKLLIIQ